MENAFTVSWDDMKLAIGIMSGTSLDGVDVALVKIEGSFTSTEIEVIDFKTFSIDEDIKAKIISQLDEKTSNVKVITSLNFEIAKMFSKQVEKLLIDNQLINNDIDYIASHGQTIYHLPKKTDNESPSTLQLGDGSVLANLTGIKTISNFRVADMAVGGQGAPLVPYADYCLFSSKEKNRIMLNIGGIANITYLKKDGKLDDVVAFDTGPGNMIINYLMEEFYNLPFDKNGEVAKKGKVIDELLNSLLVDQYFDLKPPKSTGREYFGKNYVKKIIKKYKNCKKEDLISTLTHFTAKTIALGCKLLNNNLSNFELIVSGGGANNSFLMELIQIYLHEPHVLKSSDFNLDVDVKEAVAFVLLGNETLLGNPSNVKSATGAKKQVILGQVSNVLKNAN